MEEKKAHILIVDDAEENRMIMETLASDLGYTFTSAENGKAALEVIRKKIPDIVLLDIQMPEMDGYETLKTLRENSAWRELPVVMVTSVDEEESVIKCLKLGADDYLPKPIQVEILKARIINSLAKYALIKNERDLLEKTLSGSVRILIDMLSVAWPDLFGRSVRIRRIARMLAEKTGFCDFWLIEVSAMLSNIGLLMISPEIIEKTAAGKQLNPAETEKIEKHPLIGYDIIKKIPRLEAVAETVKYQNKYFDGRGFPQDKIMGINIPMGSRLLRLAMDYDGISRQNTETEKIMESMKSRTGAYDPRLLAALEDIIVSESRKEIKSLNINQLEPGMILAQDLVTKAGSKTASRWQEISGNLLQRIQNIAGTAGIPEPVKVIIAKKN
ncbi:MAG: hypothetical protein A2096_06700 [Spirochaetes bacterium GWF1_41_5]|nr:MAG: hypothetical protein A2096_06700 [Spirochaetes bacterium GWF1_41_5]HBE01061.1 hypothetical protein [Spirochaetia bacterium]